MFYAVIYEGRNPVMGREWRRWHRCDDRAAAEQLAIDLTERRARQRHTGSSLTVAENLLGQWLPAKEATLAPTTHARYITSVEHYLLPHLGDTPLRRLRTEHFEALYRRLLIVGSRRGGPLAAKTITNLHQIVRSSLNDAVERGLLTSNPSEGAHVPDPRKRPSARRRARSWTATELNDFLTDTATNRHSMPFRLAAATMNLLARWRRQQTAELAETGAANTHGLVFTRPDGQPIHPHSISQAFDRAQRHLDVSPIRFHDYADIRHTHASLLIMDGAPVKVVSERLGHANVAFTMHTYQHLLPGMSAAAARQFAALLAAHRR